MRRDETTPKDDRDPLDELLATARWPEPEADRLARLARRWRLVSPLGRRRRPMRVAAVVAVAAAVAAAMLIGWLLPGPSRPPGPEVPLPETIAGGPDAVPLPVPEMPKTPVVRRDSLAGSRAPTPLESLVFNSRTRSSGPSAEAPTEDPVARAIRHRLDNPECDLDELAGPLLADRGRHERALAWEARESTGLRQVAAVELLGRVAGARSVPLLIQWSRQRATRAAAFRALGRVADAGTVGELVRAETDRRVREELLAALLARGDGASMAVYLGFVLDRATIDAALAAVDGAEQVPAEQLFEFFDSPRQRERFAAAVVLGRLDDPEIPARLIRMVVRDTRRREALVALASSPDPQAGEFVRLAERDSGLRALMSEARFHAESMVPRTLETIP